MKQNEVSEYSVSSDHVTVLRTEQQKLNQRVTYLVSDVALCEQVIYFDGLKWYCADNKYYKHRKQHKHNLK